MARQLVGIGSSANDGTGDTLRDGIDKVNDNFIEIYGKIGDGTTIGTFTTTGITSTGDFTIDGSADIILDADGGDVFFKDAGTTFGSATNTSGNLIVKSGTTTALTFSGANVTAAGTIGSGAITSTGVVTATGFTIGSAVINEAELETIDGITAGTVAASKAIVVDSNKAINELTVDDVAINGKVVTMTGSSGDTAVFTAGTNGTLDITTTDTAAAAANIQITADGTAELAGTTVTLDSSGGITLDADNGTITFADDGSSLGTITSDGYTGNVVGNVTGNTSGTAATVTTAAQTNITSLGTLTALTVDDVVINGKVVTMTGSTSDTAVFTAGTNGTLSIVTTDDSAAAANITITADGTAELAGTTVTLNSSGGITLDADNGTITFADASSSLGTITSDGYTGNVVGNVTGNTSGTALTVTQAAQTAITSLGTLTALTVDDVVIDGKVMTMTGSSSDTAVFTAGTNGTLSIVTTDAAAAAANIQITADGTAELAGTTVTLDSEGDIVLDANGADIFFKDDGTTFGSATNSSGNLIVKSGTTTALTFAGANVTAAGTVDSGAITSTGVVTGTGFTIGSAAILEAELEILDGATVTTTELNLLDGGTDVGGGITVADADGFIVNDAGTMKTIPATSVKTYAATTVTVPASSNMIINGDMVVAQRGITITDTAVNNVSTTTNADDSYTLDRWILVSDGDNIVDVTQSADAPDGGSTKSIRLDVETVDKQFGIVQWIEHQNCHEAIGETVSLSFKMKVTGAKMDDVRAAVVSWSGAADSPTSDIVATWESEGTVPTLASNVTYENTAADLSPTTSWATYTIENVSVDTSSTDNIGVFIWSGVDDTDAGNYLYVTDVQLETGASAHAFKRKPVSQTIKDCERYYETSMSWGEDSQYAGQKVVYGLGSATFGASVNSIGGIQYRCRKRTTPTTVIYDQNGLAGAVYTVHSGAIVSGTVAAQHTMDYGFLFATKSGAFEMGYAYYYGYIADAEL